MLHTLAFFLFAAAALGGAYMTVQIAKGAAVPASLGKGHGMAALAALVILFLANLLGREATPALAWWAFIVFLAGFVGGITVIAQVFEHRPPLWFAALHGGLAVVGLILLFGTAF
ncbi:MAG: hypothetical protein L0H19_02750 [Salinisphaera sp.]|nr:hypothetical protein [Salinisphaera sp.]